MSSAVVDRAKQALHIFCIYIVYFCSTNPQQILPHGTLQKKKRCQMLLEVGSKCEYLKCFCSWIFRTWLSPAAVRRLWWHLIVSGRLLNAPATQHLLFMNLLIMCFFHTDHSEASVGPVSSLILINSSFDVSYLLSLWSFCSTLVWYKSVASCCGMFCTGQASICTFHLDNYWFKVICSDSTQRKCGHVTPMNNIVLGFWRCLS